MVSKLFNNKNKVCKIAVPTVVLLFVVILAYKYDFYYALNDDAGIRDLLSGNYTGKPEAHCMQVLYPLALLYAGLYKLLPQVPWFGLSMFIIQIMVVVGIAEMAVNALMSQGKEESKACSNGKYLITAVLVVSIIIVLSLKELVFLQYTVCAALICIFIMADILLSSKGEERLVLDIIGYLYALSLREEMGLLMIPFIGMAILFKCNLSLKQLFTKRWIMSVSVVILCMSMLFTVDKIAYSGDWGEFRDFFNARTEVYDYTGIPDYEDNIDFYESNNITKSQYESLRSYNFALDESINTHVLKTIGEYARANAGKNLFRRIYDAMYTCVYDFMHGWELGFSLLIWIGYIFLYRLSLNEKNWVLFFKTSLVIALRMFIWIYMYSLGRQGGLADRITHPLFLAELMLIIGLLITDNIQQRWKFATTFCIISTYACLLLVFLLGQIKSTDTEYSIRSTNNAEWTAFQTCVKQKEGYYYIDVYSAVKYSEKIFEKEQEKLRNYEIAGGWISKSPAFYEKANKYGFKNPEDGIANEKAYFLANINDVNSLLQDKVK